MNVTITTYGCAEYLRRTGFSVTGELVFHSLDAKRVMMRDVQKAVSSHYKIPLREMWSARRTREVARPRQVAMYLCKQLTLRSLPEIGRKFGDRDHTTVIHACRQIEKLMASDPEIRADVRMLSKDLSA